MELAVLQDQPELELAARPRTRGDCVDGERPCPWVGCRHHLALEVTPAGTLQLLGEPHELVETCALDVADRGPHTLEEISQCFELTRERIRQIEERVMPKLRERLERIGIDETVMAELGRPMGGNLAQAQGKDGGRVGIGWPGPLPEDVARATGRHSEFAISERSCRRRKPAEEGDMSKESLLDQVQGEAAKAVKDGVAGKLTPAELVKRLAELNVNVSYALVWDYLRRHKAGAIAGKRKAKPKAKAPRRKRQEPEKVCAECGHTECVCDQEPEASSATVALVARPREPGFVVLLDGTILAPSAQAAVEVAQLLRGASA